MRGSRMNGYIGEFKSSFLSCEKDTETIIKKLFVDSKPYSDMLKRLLLINTPDCLNDMTNPAYLKKIKETSIQDLKEQGYLRFGPKIALGENEEVKSYIRLSFDHFTPSKNEHFRDCIVEIDILCHPEYWDIGNFRQRPLKIAGYIDGILNENKLSGIGTLNFAGCNELLLDENLAGYCLMYTAVHGNDDLIENDD
jgi:hypothetical protein